MFAPSTALLALSAIPLVFGATFNVTVGGPGGVIKFDPEFVNAQAGDEVLFTFQQKNHTVTQSTFDDPCNRVAGGFDSGFQFVNESNTAGPFPQARFVVPSSSSSPPPPVWVFCRQTGHCQQGMVFAINPGSNATFAQFKATATGNSSSTSSSSLSSSASSSSSGSVSASSATSAQTTSVVSSTAIVTSSSQTSTTASSAPTSSTANNHLVVVGGPAGNVYTPSNITAQPGDTVTFQFMTKNHTATQSSFAVPCSPLAGSSTSGQVGFDSGFMPVAANASSFPTYTITINGSAPVWVFCRQTGHCGSGMTFSVNAVENGPNNYAAFKNNAIEQNGTASAAKSASSAKSTSSSASVRASVTRSAGIAGFALANVLAAFAFLV